jgi:hypothetical protein
VDAGTWHDKGQEAVELGGYLVAINSPEENEFIRERWLAERIFSAEFEGTDCPQVLPPLPWSNPRVFERWMGITDRAVEGTYVGLNGDPVTFTNWFFHTPSLIDHEVRDFGLFASGGIWIAGGRCFDIRCASRGGACPRAG